MLALGLLIAQSSTAQEAQGGISLQFLTFPKSMEIMKVEMIIGEGRTMTIDVSSNELSQVVRVPALPAWVFGKMETDENNKPIFKTYGQTKALSNDKQLILLIRKGKELADGLEVRAIANDISNFGGGEFLFMNAAKVDIAGETGGVTFALKPGAMTIIKPKAEENGRLFHAMFYFRRDEEPRPFFSSKWPISDTTRGLIFFYHDPDSAQLRLHTIRHFMGS
jgi:hypothetical protein